MTFSQFFFPILIVSMKWTHQTYGSGWWFEFQRICTFSNQNCKEEKRRGSKSFKALPFTISLLRVRIVHCKIRAPWFNGVVIRNKVNQMLLTWYPSNGHFITGYFSISPSNSCHKRITNSLSHASSSSVLSAVSYASSFRA